MSDLLVLHALRIKGVASEEAIAVHSGLALRDVRNLLEVLDRQGLVRAREGLVSGWSLSAQGRDRERDLIAAELCSTGAREALMRAYEEFRALNLSFLQTCTDWQIRHEGAERVVNDHLDDHYDSEVMSRLDKNSIGLASVIEAIATVMPRFGTYLSRLASATNQVSEGQLEWFTSPLVDSVHSVWFEFHEDLLATLDVPRSTEV